MFLLYDRYIEYIYSLCPVCYKIEEKARELVEFIMSTDVMEPDEDVVVEKKSPPDYVRVKNEVERLLRENTIIDPPISPKEIAKNLGIKVIFGQFPDDASEVMGFYDCAHNQIYVNSEDPVNRQTFTIAHELGHAVLHRKVILEDSSKYQVLLRRPLGAATDSFEKEANAFAAHLLVPKQFLDKYYKIASIPELARLFIVSEEVIRFRLRLEYGL